MNGLSHRRVACDVTSHLHIAVDQDGGAATLVGDIRRCVAASGDISTWVAIPNGCERAARVVGQAQLVIRAAFNRHGGCGGAHGIHKGFGQDDFVGPSVLGDVQHLKVAHLWCGDGAQIERGRSDHQAVRTRTAINAVCCIKYDAVVTGARKDGVSTASAIKEFVAAITLHDCGAVAAEHFLCISQTQLYRASALLDHTTE